MTTRKKLRITVGETTVLLPICDLCGCVIGDQAHHDGWHEHWRKKNENPLGNLFGGRL